MSNFNWQEKKADLEWFNDSNLNMALTVIDKHLNTPLAKKKALIIEDDDGKVSEFTYGRSC